MPEVLYWIDTAAAYEAHLLRSNLAALVRNYVAGVPYDNPFDPKDMSNQIYWRQIMRPTEEEGRAPLYLHNGAQDLVNAVTVDVLPQGTRLRLRNEDPEKQQSVFDAILHFAGSYGSGVNGLMDWTRSLLYECAQCMDGLIMPRLIGEEIAGKPFVELDFQPMENWNVEVEQRTSRVLFYRVEYKYPVIEAGQDPMTPVTHWKWYREDFWSDKVINYEPADVEVRDIPPLTGPLVAPILEVLPGRKPPRMTEKTDPELGRKVIEEEVLKRAAQGKPLAFPVLWKREGVKDERGSAELQVHQLRDIDQINRLYWNWINHAHHIGDPPLTTVNVQVPVQKNQPIPSASDRGDDEAGGRNRKKRNLFAPGAVNSFNARSGEQFWVGYPYNQPTSAPHETVAAAIKACLMGVSLNAILDPEKISHFGQLTGYTTRQMQRHHNEMIAQHRWRAMGQVQDALNASLRLARAAGIVDVAEGAYLEWEYGKPPMTAAEVKDYATAYAMLQKTGIPISELVDLIPIDVKDEKKLIEEVEKFLEEQNALEQQMQLGQQEGEVGGVDKQTIP